MGKQEETSTNEDDLSVDSVSDSADAPDSDSTGPLDFLIGIGASAGGLRSIELLVADLDLSPESNASFVIVQHLAPDVDSFMSEILQRSTNIPIRTIEHGEAVQGNVIYLVPPGMSLRLTNGVFELVKIDRNDVLRPIDKFFVSMAEEMGKRSIGIVVSGSGVDGTEGIKAIRVAGGTTLVESFKTAQFDSMPRSCNSTGCVDAVLKIPEISRWVNLQLVDPSSRPSFAEIEQKELTGTDLIFSLLSTAYQVDFSGYKPGTITRRIERRQQLCRCASLADYAQYVRDTPDELESLYGDLLIGVTKFFRDGEAFDLITRCIDDIVRNLGPDETLRLWSAGCATGEEAYSLAMLAHQSLERHNKPINFKVFATDIHNGSLNHASRGQYDLESMEFVNSDLRRRFFGVEDDQHFRVTYDLRRYIVFAHHNVFTDPPFTRIHLVCCRNLLIYLRPEKQRQALQSFLFSLLVDGVLVLGNSENLGELHSNFRTIDANWKIYQKTSSTAPVNRALSFPLAKLERSQPARRLVNFLNSDQPNTLSFTRLLDSYELILQNLVHCGILIDKDRHILHVFGEASKYLISQHGRFTGNVTELLPGETRVAITAGLIRASKDPDQIISLDGVQFPHLEDERFVDVRIRALEQRQNQGQVWLIEFSKRSNKELPSTSITGLSPSDYSDLREIEAELIYTKDNLNATIEELEASNEELSATNEELVASNEELQSTNEELQSVNEELVTVNHENNRKIDELEELSNDLEYIINNSAVGTLFLDRELAIRKFTDRIRLHFGLMPSDIGRQITHFRSKLRFDDFAATLQNVLDTGEEYFGTIQDENGGSYLVRIETYERDEETDGVVVNVSEQLQEIRRGAIGSFELSQTEGIWHWPDVASDEMYWSEEFREIAALTGNPRFSALLAAAHEEDRCILNSMIKVDGAIASGNPQRLRLKFGDDSYRQIDICVTFHVVRADQLKSISGYISSVED